MTVTGTRTPDTVTLSPAEVGAAWLAEFAAALSRPGDGFGDVLTADCTWRDFLAFSWDLTNYVGLAEVEEGLTRLVTGARPGELASARGQAPFEIDGDVLFFFELATDQRECRGFARLHRGVDDRWRAMTLMTHAERLADHPTLTGHHRPDGKVHGYVPDRTRWVADRERELEFEDVEPQVVILGAGHNGLTVAARLKAHGVSALVLERDDRVGDVWRKRYASLALHSLMGADHLAYYRFPDTWTAHTPKDKFADHLESYSRALDLNVWTGTQLLDASYDDDRGEWTIRVRRDGVERVLRPRHFVVAAGLNGAPKIPAVEGLEDFEGTAVHSGEFQGGADWAGKKVVVVGSAVSGHEIAHDLYEHGAEVTMIQRSATYVINFETFNDLWYGVYAEGSPLAPEFADMVAYANPNRANKSVNQMLVELAAERDKELLDKLQERGFRLEWGPDRTGIIGKHMSGVDSYQINIGASELIADGLVGVRSGVEVTAATPHGVVLSDGSELEADLIVFATGYEPMFETIRPVLGSAADKVQKVYGLADDDEYSETWRRSRQPGLWFATGFVTMARFHSKPMTLLIKAIEEGVIPADADADPTGAAASSGRS